MMRSMYSGVSGLRIHQTKMDVIGNNIANVNTIGFKASRATFNEVFSQTLRDASAPNENMGGRNPMQIGLGASVASVDVNMGEGAAQRTDNTLDLKIEGEGFFIVSDPTGNKFTRAGDFKIDTAGNLVTSNGLNVMGWTANPQTGKIEKSIVEKIQILSPDNIYSQPSYTEKLTLSGNINKNDAQLDATAGGVPFTATVYDSLGYTYTAEFKITSDGGAGTDYKVELASVTDEKGKDITGANIGTVTFKFDPATGKITGNTTFEITGLQTDFSKFSDPVEVDFSSLTLFKGNTTVESYTGDKNGLGAGCKAGILADFEIGGDGTIVGKYTNGANRILGQIPIATFQNPTSLKKVGSNLYVATTNSGEFDGIGEDVTSSGASFNSGVLEMSNVDLSLEFTEMITTQRGFQANSRIISVSDEILQELVNLKR